MRVGDKQGSAGKPVTARDARTWLENFEDDAVLVTYYPDDSDDLSEVESLEQRLAQKYFNVKGKAITGKVVVVG